MPSSLEYKVDDDIRIRQIELSDGDEIFRLIDSQRAYLKQWLAWVDSTDSSVDTKTYIETCSEDLSKNRTPRFVIRYRGEAVGMAGFNSINWQHQYGILGYWLSADHTGKGIMSKTCQILVRHGFKKLNLQKIEIHCASKNKPSRAIPERLGFQLEGTLRKREFLYNTYVDHVIYGLLASEFKE